MPYHHGHLREALIDAGVQLARTDGPGAVQVRTACRAVGVSHNGGHRHFADRDELLGEVGQRCMAELATLMLAGLEDCPGDGNPETAWTRLKIVGRAYVEFALAETGWFRTAFGHPGHGTSSPETTAPYQLLGAMLDELVATGAISPARRPMAELAAWSAVHGLATLLTDGPLRTLHGAERAAAIEKVLDDACGSLRARPG